MPARAKKAKSPYPSPKVSKLSELFAVLEANERPFDRDWLTRVYEYSKKQHADQTRSSGEPYIQHPLSVAYLLAEMNFDERCIAVGLLHDVLEDTGVTQVELAAEFDEEIAALVDGVSKIGRHSYVRRDEAQAETFRKLVLASAKDIRVIVVKLADRLHNMMTLSHLEDEKRSRIARETLEIYAPIAHRLGMSAVKHQLEDLAFFNLHPHQFAELQLELKQKVKDRQGATNKIDRQLREELAAAELNAETSYRIKGYNSIYQKLRRRDIDLSELYDYIAFRVIVDDVSDCYAALGVVHQAWRPIPGRFKDYIAVPKPNLYQSLHTTLVGENGQPFEVQIRTKKMDQVAEEGIAAHWAYKEGRASATQSDEKIQWLRHLLEWQQEIQDPRTFLSTLKIDLYPDEVYVFTPKGEVHSFPRGATPLDFAYRIHTEVGHHCSGARVNGRLVSLRTALGNGDIIEVLTNPNREPSRDWLSMVATPRAKSKIRHWLNTRQKERAVEIGRSVLERELRKFRGSVKKAVESEKMTALLKDDGLSDVDDLFSRIGFGRTEVRAVVRRLLSEAELETEAQPPSRIRQAVNRFLGETGVTVKGHGDMLAYLAKCCRPLPGDPIVGYVTRGRGVAVHAEACPNVRNLLYHPEREIAVEWDRKTEGKFEAVLTIRGEDSPGLLAKMTEVIAKHDSNIRNIEASTADTGRYLVEVMVEIVNRKQLDRLTAGLLQLPGISRVDRRMGAGQELGSSLLDSND
jgi:GTP pyrophosphokinase